MENYLNMPPEILIADILAGLMAILLAMTIHEFFHAFAASKLGDDTPRLMGRLTLNPLKHIDPIGLLMLLIFKFGWAKPVEINPNRFKNYRKGLFLTCLAGPLSNIICAVLGSLLWVISYKFLPQESQSNFASNLLTLFCAYFTIYNLILALFNLIPVYPLDGFKMLTSLSKHSNWYIQFNLRYGRWLLIIVAVFGGIYISAGVSYLADVLTAFWRMIFKW